MRDISSIEAAITLQKRAMAMRTSPGYNDFLEAIRGVTEAAMRTLVAEDMTDAHMREQRGRVRAFQDVTKLLTNDRAIETLEGRLQELQNAAQEALRRRPKPRGEP